MVSDVISLYFMYCSVCLVFCVFDSVCELYHRELFGDTIRNIVGVVAILLLNVMNVFSMGEGALLVRPCMVFQRMCVLCL